jgi:hypothetical protein
LSLEERVSRVSKDDGHRLSHSSFETPARAGSSEPDRKSSE